MDRSQLQKATGRRGRSRRAGGQFARAARFGGVVGAGLGGFDFLDDVGCRWSGFGGLEGEEAEEGEFGVGGCGGHFEWEVVLGFMADWRGLLLAN